jgi:hypothetical protein
MAKVWSQTAAIDILFFFGTNLFLIENVFPLGVVKLNYQVKSLTIKEVNRWR